MNRRLIPLLMICLAGAGVAYAQSGWGGRGHGNRNASQADSSGQPASSARPARAARPVDESEIVGVVQTIDPQSNRVTIAYEAVAARNWPPGVMPFVVNKPDLLKDVTVGERVRFKLDSEQITELQPY